MKDDLQLNGKGERTQQSYLRMLRKFTEFLQREPDTATEDDLRYYLLHIKNQKLWSNSTINVAYCSLKFFFAKTCPRDWPTLKKLKVQPELKLPTILTIDEVQILLKLIDKPAMFSFFTTVYSMGLTTLIPNECSSISIVGKELEIGSSPFLSQPCSS
jgi:site-specific recombinase XerD